VGTRGGDALALDPATGGELWRTPIGPGLSLAPAVLPGEVVVFVSDAGVVSALEPDGRIRYSFPSGATCTAAPTATADGVVYVPGGDGVLRAYDASGTRVLQAPLGGVRRAALTTSAVPHAGWVYVGRSDGELLALSSSLTRGAPGDAGNVLRAIKRGPDVVFEWTGAAPACAYNVRGGTGRGPLPDDPIIVTVPPGLPSDPGAIGRPGKILYHLHGLSCCAALEGL
jgi:hypothetical protein